MTDTHNHILFGVDDGAKTIEESLQMLSMAKADGIDHIILTPHYITGRYENEDVDMNYDILKQRMEEENIDIKLYKGNEIYLNEENIEAILEKKPNTLANSDYILVELPFTSLYPFHMDMLYKLQLKGYKLVLAHIDRYGFFKQNIELLRQLIQRGAFGQMSSRYITDIKTRKAAIKWIKSGYVHVIASDGHNLRRRLPVLSEAYKVVSKKIGEEKATLLFESNPNSIISNDLFLENVYELK